jgi:hypothetical protein
VYGQNHRYCQNCGHAVYSGYGRQCPGCGLGFGEMIMLDEALDGGMWSQGGAGIGFDFADGEPVFNMGDGFGIEPDGQADLDVGGFDIPI